MLLIANVTTVLGNTNKIPYRNVVTMEPNLAPNPSFEEGDFIPTGWTYADTNGIYTWDSNYAYSDEKSIGVLNLTNAYPYRIMWITTDFIPVNCTKTSYMFSAWFKFVDIPEYQYARISVQMYNGNYERIGGGSAGRGSTDTEWHQIMTTTGYDHGSIKYVKLELGQAFNEPYEPDPLIEIRFDDANFSIWNTVPDTPTIKGETHGRVLTLYDYTFTTNDPEQDNVSYEIEWGDNTTQTTDFYESGEKVIISHIWGIERTYQIKVRSIDEDNAKSDWATLDVTMPYSYTGPFMQFWMKLLERFPNAFPILRQLVEY